MSKPKVIINKPDKLVSLRSIKMSDEHEYKEVQDAWREDMHDDQQLEETSEEDSETGEELENYQGYEHEYRETDLEKGKQC